MRAGDLLSLGTGAGHTDALMVFGNHLWQSTVFAAAVWLVTLLLGRNQARVRYGLWLAASVKFLVPFSLLIALGSLLPKPHRIVAGSAIYSAMDVTAQPFSENAMLSIAPAAKTTGSMERFTAQLPVVLAAVWLCGVLTVLLIWIARWKQVLGTLRRAEPADEGREVDLLHQLQQALSGRKRIPLRMSNELMEPGIFGVVRPVLLWPEYLSERLDDEHVEAILTHELMHVQRHDNLTAAIHMLVEAVFWFHPMVWWMEARMVEEREHACDQAVVEIGGRPEVYAESLLKACRFCVESPLTCISGITGADLNRRIHVIMTLRLEKLSAVKRLILAGASIAAVLLPLMLGMWRPVRAQSRSEDAGKPAFEVATVKQSKADTKARIRILPNGYSETGISLKAMISNAYGIRQELISGAPSWTGNTAYDIEAKEAEPVAAALQKLPNDQRVVQIQLMLQTLLENRFHLKVSHVAKELPIYQLEIAKAGFKLKEAGPNNTYASGIKGPDGVTSAGLMRTGSGQVIGQGVPISRLAVNLSYQVDRSVVDKTGLTGNYDFILKWTPDMPNGAQPADDSGPSLFTALQEQLGLKLEPTKGPVDTLVIEHVEKPSEN